MSAIETYLQYIANKVWARDVRTAIVNAIRQCYDDVHNPTLNTEALQAAIQAKIDAGQMAALTIGDRTITAAKLALGVIPTPDTTLSQSGIPADAKTTGDEISAINESLGDVRADLDSQTGIIRLVKNYYINTSTTPISLTPLASSAGRMYAIVDCAQGDKFVINAYSDFPAARTWCFIDNANNAVSMADANATVTDLELTAPENAVKLIINDISGGMSYKVGNNLGSKVIALDLAVKTMERGLSNDAKEALLTCFKHVAWSDVHGRDYYDALERALYAGIDLPVVYWNYSLGRVPSNDDMITTNTTGSKSITFNQNLGMYITGGSSSDNVIFAPTEYPTCKKAYIEITFTITTIEGTGSFAVRLSNGVSGYNCSMGMVSVNNVLVFRMMYQTGDNYETVIIPKFTPEFNTEYKLRVEYENGGTNKIYINDALLHETQEVTTKWTTANRVMVVGGVSVYIKNMKWGIEEV